MRVRLTDRADAELSAIYSHIRRESPRAAQRVRSAIRDRVRLLGRFPALGRRTSLPGERELVIAGTPYIVRYELIQDEVRVLRVRDALRGLI